MKPVPVPQPFRRPVRTIGNTGSDHHGLDQMPGPAARERPEPVFELARAMFKDAWNQRLVHAAGLARSCGREAEKSDKQIEVLLDRIVEAGSPTIVAAYEKRVALLERGKFALEEQRANAGQRPGTFEELFELAFQFLANFSKL